MSNIISLAVPPRRQRLAERAGPLIAVFARHRRIRDDVFWLKENAELLNILECAGPVLPYDALVPHEETYAELAERLRFFPQYYRFLLSMGLDLEDLGLQGTQMEGLCAWVARQGLPEAELSDLQRAEARRLLARRNVRTVAADPGLDDRLRAFVARPETFALPNKKAAYELTHIVFYLSEYGRRAPDLPQEARTSLEYVGLLAFLEQNLDLLAEVCIALRQAGYTPSPIWEDAVRDGLARFAVVEGAAARDDYHEYLVSAWAACAMGADDSGAVVPSGQAQFVRPATMTPALRTLSGALYAFGAQRSDDWGAMRSWVADMMDDDSYATLAAAEASSPIFDAFFAGFARASAPAEFT